MLAAVYGYGRVGRGYLLKLNAEYAVFGQRECVLAICESYRFAVHCCGLHAIALVRGHCESYLCANGIISSCRSNCAVFAEDYGYCRVGRGNLLELNSELTTSRHCECVLAVRERNFIAVHCCGLHAVALVRGNCQRYLVACAYRNNLRVVNDSYLVSAAVKSAGEINRAVNELRDRDLCTICVGHIKFIFAGSGFELVVPAIAVIAVCFNFGAVEFHAVDKLIVSRLYDYLAFSAFLVITVRSVRLNQHLPVIIVTRDIRSCNRKSAKLRAFLNLRSNDSIISDSKIYGVYAVIVIGLYAVYFCHELVRRGYACLDLCAVQGIYGGQVVFIKGLFRCISRIMGKGELYCVYLVIYKAIAQFV